MKKILTLLALTFSLFLVSCNSSHEGGVSENAKKNLETQHAVINMFSTGDFSKTADYLAPDCVDYAAMGADGGPVKGVDSIKAYFIRENAKMGDMKSETIVELANDEYVMTHMKYSATLKVDMMEMRKKAGETMSGTTIELSKFKDGKCVAHWTFMEPAEMMKMMPQMQPAGMSADTSKPK